MDNLVSDENAILEMLNQDLEEEVADGESQETEYEKQIDSEEETPDFDDTDRDPDYSPESENTNQLAENIKKIIARQTEDNVTVRKKRKCSKADSGKSSTRISKTVTGTTVQSKIISIDKDKIAGKNGFIWNRDATSNFTSKVTAKNIVHVKVGPTAESSKALDPLACLKLFFDEDILSKILIHTNQEIERQRSKYSDKHHANISNVTAKEIHALIGLLVLTAAMKDNHVRTDLLFNTTYSGTRYRATMSESRFKFLINCLRFDNTETRATRLQNNRFAPISEVWQMFIENCKTKYVPGVNITIDEQLIGFRGRCKFRMYIPSKPDKYGLKLVAMCDSESKYLLNAMPYLGKGTVPQDENAGTYFVQQLTRIIKGSHRNITVDNWFTSVPLAQNLLKEFGLTLIGTIKKNKRELPEELVNIKYKDRTVGSSMFLFSEDVTVVSYKGAENKLVTLISTVHGDTETNPTNGKPTIIMDYNATKGGVDSMDQMCHAMSCNRKTQRWPLCFFYNMLNIAFINAYVIYSFNKLKQPGQKVMSRTDFMIQLHEQLTIDQQRQRLSIPNLRRGLREIVSSVTTAYSEPVPTQSESNTSAVADSDPIPGTSQSNSSASRKYCDFCSYKKRRKTSTECTNCQKYICGEHQGAKLCKECTVTVAMRS